MRICLTLLIAGLAWSLGDVPSPAQQQPEKKPRVDAFGDPLPDGAVARLGTVRWRHHDEIGTAVLSPDGKRVASSAGDYDSNDDVYMWESATGKLVWRIPLGPTKNFQCTHISCLAFSPDGSTLVAGFSESNTSSHLSIFDVQTGKSKGEWKDQEHAVLAIKFADNGKTLVSIDENGLVRWWDVATLKQTKQWQAFKALILPLAGKAVWAPTGDNFLVRVPKKGSGSEVLMIDAALRKKVWTIQLPKEFAPLAYSADGTMVAIGAFPLKDPKNPPGLFRKNGVIVCDAATGNEKFRADGNSVHIAFGSEDKQLAVADSFGFRIYDIATQKIVKRHKTNVHSGATKGQVFEFCHDGKSVLLASSKTSLRVQSTIADKADPESFDSEEPAESLQFSADGRMLHTGFHDSKTLVTWDLENARVKTVSRFPAEQDDLIGDVSPDHMLSVSVNGGEVQVWDRPTQKALSTLHFPPVKSGGKRRVSNLTATFSPTNHHVVVAINFETTWYVFETRTGKFVLQFNEGAPKGSTFGAAHNVLPAFSPDNKVMAVGKSDGKITLYDLGKGVVKRQLEGAQPKWLKYGGFMAFSPDGRYFAARGHDDGITYIWEAESGTMIRKFPAAPKALPIASLGTEGNGATLAFSPDSRMLATPHNEDCSIVQVWELPTGNLRRELKGHLGPISALAWSPDGRLLASGSTDTTVLAWDVWGSEKR